MANENNDPGQTPAPDNDPNAQPAANGDASPDEGFNLLDAVDEAYERIDEQGNVTEAKPKDETASKPDDGEGADGSETAGAETDPDKPDEGPDGETKPGDKPAEGGEADKPDGETKPQEPPLELTDEDKKLFDERGQQRVQSLIERVKSVADEKTQAETERDTYRDQYEAVAGVLRDTGASTDVLGNMLDLTAELVSGDPRRGQQAVQRAFEMVKGYARQYGVSLPQASLLDAYPDLQQQVEAGTLTQEAAEENARLRSQQANYDAQRNQQVRANAEQQQYQQSAAQAQTSLNQMLADWQAKDPDFERKAPLMQDYAQQLAQQIVAGEVHPSRVAGLIKERYDTITSTMKTVAESLRSTQPKEPNPVRPGASRSAGQEAGRYKSVEEAIDQEYERMPANLR